MRFRDRIDAAEQLVAQLAPYRGRRPVVLAIPRGGVPMGRILADGLQGELDVVLVHKLGAPGNPEFAVGAVDERGRVYRDPHGEHLPQDWIDAQAARELAVLHQRREQYGPSRELDGRVVIVVDDGVATGQTMGAALSMVKDAGAAEVVVAIGVAPPETVDALEQVADTVVCLHTPLRFGAVGFHFDDFSQVDDASVTRALTAE